MLRQTSKAVQGGIGRLALLKKPTVRRRPLGRGGRTCAALHTTPPHLARPLHTFSPIIHFGQIRFGLVFTRPPAQISAFSQTNSSPLYVASSQLGASSNKLPRTQTLPPIINLPTFTNLPRRAFKLFHAKAVAKS